MKTISDVKLKKASQVLKAISDDRRLEMVKLIRSKKEMCQKDMLSNFDVDQPTMSHHLTILQKSGIIKYRKVGKFSYFYVDEDRLSVVLDLVDTIVK